MHVALTVCLAPTEITGTKKKERGKKPFCGQFAVLALPLPTPPFPSPQSHQLCRSHILSSWAIEIVEYSTRLSCLPFLYPVPLTGSPMTYQPKEKSPKVDRKNKRPRTFRSHTLQSAQFFVFPSSPAHNTHNFTHHLSAATLLFPVSEGSFSTPAA